eukprot:5475540-Pyramimonas_sp.AAC.1
MFVIVGYTKRSKTARKFPRAPGTGTTPAHRFWQPRFLRDVDHLDHMRGDRGRAPGQSQVVLLLS